MILKKRLWFQEKFLSTAFHVDLYLGNISYFNNLDIGTDTLHILCNSIKCTASVTNQGTSTVRKNLTIIYTTQSLSSCRE